MKRVGGDGGTFEGSGGFFEVDLDHADQVFETGGEKTVP